MAEFIYQWLRDRRGVTAIEYGLVAVLVGGFVITSMSIIGNAISSVMMTVASHLG